MQPLARGFTFSFVLIVILVIVGVILTFLIEAFISSTSSTPKGVIDEIIKHLNLKKGDKFADLGMGKGDIVVSALQRAEVFAVGIEMSPILAMLASIRLFWINLLSLGKKKNEVIVDNFLTQKLNEYDVVYCNLPQNVLDVMEKRFELIKDSDTEIFTYENKFSEHSPKAVFKLSNGKNLYQY